MNKEKIYMEKNTYLAHAVVEAEPEEEEAAQKGGLKHGVKHARYPTIDEERQREDGVCGVRQSERLLQ